MFKLPLIEASQASPDVVEIYDDFKTKMGFPAAPNFIKAQGASLTVVRGTWELVKNILVEGLLPRSLKEMAFVAISKDRGCQYCEAAHLACCRMLGVDAKTIELLVSNIREIAPKAARDALLFAIKCSRAPQSLTDEDFVGLKQNGFLEPEITELIAMSGLAVYANIMADATGVAPDEMFGNY